MITTLDKLPSDIKNNDRVIKLNQYQDDFIFSSARFPALVAAWGTGKTMCGIERLRLDAEKYHKNLSLVIRKEFVDLKDSTMKDWESYTGIKINSSRDAVFPNGSIVMFRHGEELHGNNLNNINLGNFLIEQAEEFDSDEVFFKLHGRLRRANVPHWGAVIANTNGHNWIYNLWKKSPSENYHLIEAKTIDNSHNLPKDFIDSLEDLNIKKPKTYKRFVENSWDESDDTDIVILPEWVQGCVDFHLWQDPNDVRRIISIDVARYGDDRTVFYAIESGRVVAKETHAKLDNMQVVGMAQVFQSRYLATNNYAVDEIGTGTGVVDRLKELGKNVFAINGSGRTDKKFYNNRAMIYNYCADQIREKKVSIPSSESDLIEQLSWAKYKEVKSNGMFLVESKDDIKQRYGRSPDNADAFMYGIYALQFVKKSFVDHRIAQNRNHWQGKSYVPIKSEVLRGR